MKTVLEAKNIEKVYDTGGNKFAALKGINLQVKEVSSLELWDLQVLVRRLY